MSAGLPPEETVDRVAELLRSRVGLRPEPALRGRLRRCIRDEAAEHGLGLDGYVRTLADDGDDDALQGLLNRITVQETGFFRHPEHFEVLAREILPRLSQPIKIWSAGCANGQEAFSLAMLLDELGVAGRVIASDVSTAALDRTNAARYSAREVAGLVPVRITRHLTPVGQGWEINPTVRARVSTLHHNLIDPVPDQVRSCQVVFCRNVLIYFSPQHATSFLDRVARALPAAWLFLGSAETIWSVGDRYETVRIGETYAYRPMAAIAPFPLASSRGGHGLSLAAGRTAPTRHPLERRRATVATAPTSTTTAKATKAPTRASSPDGALLSTAADPTVIDCLAEAGRQALAARDEQAAVVLFRKWVYLAQDDALAHLHLGLALEAAGDHYSARRAFGAARRALHEADPARVERAIDGYDVAELHKLLDAKRQEPAS